MININIKQRDKTDCGAACLASVAAYYKLGVQVTKIRQLAFTNQNGTSVLGIIKAANSLGFNASGVRGNEKNLDSIPFPAIAHVVRTIDDLKLHHYVVIYKVRKNKVHIMDPFYGKLMKISKEEFLKEWTGVIVLIEPKLDFSPQNALESTWRRLFKLVYPHKLVIIQALIGSIIYTVLGLSVSIYIEKITDYVLIGGNTNLLNLLSIIMIFLLLFKTGIGYFKSLIILKTGQLIDSDLVLGYYKHLMHLPQSFFDTMRVGELTSRVNDAVGIRNFINQTSINLFVNILIVFFSFALMFTYHWKLALILIAVIPFYLLIYLLTNYFNKLVERKVMEKSADMEGLLVESLSSVKTIKQFGVEEYFAERTENKFISLLYQVFNSSHNLIVSGTAAGFITSLFTILLIWFGSYFVVNGQITAGELMSFYALVGYFTGPIYSIITANKEVRNAFVATDRLFEVLDIETEIDPNKNYIDENLEGKIEFVDSTFSYDLRKTIISKLNLTIEKGTFVSIVGESGSGKTTIISLIQKLYKLQEGNLYVGGIDVNNLSTDCIRRNIAVVPQNINLFSGTIIQNVALGEYEPNLKLICELANKLGLDKFISSLPDGYYTHIGENGVLLSGGQKQRIAIMRALYRKPNILIFDEATSSLDSISECYVQNVIADSVKNGITVIVIAHRLSTIKNSSRVFVMKEGVLVEEGTFEELLEINGEFKRLWENQYL